MSSKKFDNIPDLWKNRRLGFWVCICLFILCLFLEIFKLHTTRDVYLYILGGVIGLYYLTAIIFDVFPTIKELVLEYLEKK
jgi:hypothetical protein